MFWLHLKRAIATPGAIPPVQVLTRPGAAQLLRTASKPPSVQYDIDSEHYFSLSSWNICAEFEGLSLTVQVKKKEVGGEGKNKMGPRRKFCFIFKAM